MPGTTLSPNVVTLADTSHQSPAVAYLNGRYYLAWAGQGNNRISLLSSTTPDFRDAARALAEETCQGPPALTAFAGRIWIAWTGTDPARTLSVMSFDGSFRGKTVLPATSSASPALLTAGGRLFIIWAGTDAQRRLNIAELLVG